MGIEEQLAYEPSLLVSPVKKSRQSTSEDEFLSTNFDAVEKSKIDHVVANQVLKIVLEDWMYQYGTEYNETDYGLLLDIIKEMTAKRLPLKFFIPGFPCKSSNQEKKVLGDVPDFSEFLAVRCLVTTLRKLESVYQYGVKMVILSDYHTFDQYIGVEEEAYERYHKDLKTMIHDAGASDIIQLISLASFPEFENTPSHDISTKLGHVFGGNEVLETFDDAIKKDPVMLEKYKQLKKFMQSDQSHNLPGSPRGKTTRDFIKEIARGMMAQGVALDNFLKQQNTMKDFIRLSIHHHRPSTGKFAINMFKGHECDGGILRTPWHHAIIFDSLSGSFAVDQKANVENSVVKNTCLITVTLKERPWFLMRLHLDDEFVFESETLPELEATMIRGGCGIIISCKSDIPSSAIPSSVFKEESLTSIIKEFGLVVLRGFKKFQDEDDMIDFYSKRARFGLLQWEFGPIHKVTPKENMPGYVNSYEGIPIHFDMVAPPKYMGISQKEHVYEEFVCREFLLYCKNITCKGDDGATTFVDSRGAILSLPGAKINDWKQTTVAYETQLNQKSSKEVYFGGKGNVYQYPLVMKCPWTGNDVLRWWQSWTKEEHPDSRQHNWAVIKASPAYVQQTPEELEQEIKQVALDERFFFAHSYKDGDQVYVNNYTTLHGRHGFSNGRELWRLQAVPPSDHVPRHFLKGTF